MAFTGTLVTFIKDEGFGFILSTETPSYSIYCHVSQLTNGGSEDMIVGSTMRFDVGVRTNAAGLRKPCANDVTILGKGGDGKGKGKSVSKDKIKGKQQQKAPAAPLAICDRSRSRSPPFSWQLGGAGAAHVPPTAPTSAPEDPWDDIFSPDL